MRVYNKAPLNYQAQVKLLKKRGLDIPDDKRTIEYLKRISYYRLSAFFRPYQQKKDLFNRGVSFELVLDTYNFDRELRLQVFDAKKAQKVSPRANIILSGHLKSFSPINNILCFCLPK